jgi:hypothetical protein
MTRHHHLSSSNPIPDGPRIFETKRIYVRPLAQQALDDQEIQEALDRHFRCDWGDQLYDLTADDVAKMNAAFSAGEEVISWFEAPRPGPCPFYVVTNAERTETCIRSEWDDTPEEHERTKRFLVDLAALLKTHGLTLWERTFHTGECSHSFVGHGFFLVVSEAAAWLNAEEPRDDN